jgi:hypothetical protein
MLVARRAIRAEAASVTAYRYATVSLRLPVTMSHRAKHHYSSSSAPK